MNEWNCGRRFCCFCCCLFFFFFSLPPMLLFIMVRLMCFYKNRCCCKLNLNFHYYFWIRIRKEREIRNRYINPVILVVSCEVSNNKEKWRVTFWIRFHLLRLFFLGFLSHSLVRNYQAPPTQQNNILVFYFFLCFIMLSHPCFKLWCIN